MPPKQLPFRNFFFISLWMMLSILPAISAEISPAPTSAEANTETNGGYDPMEELTRLHKEAEEMIAANKFHRAILIYQDIILMEPDDETTYANLGHVYILLGQYDKAMDTFKNTLDINPENETALAGIRKIMDPDGAIE